MMWWAQNGAVSTLDSYGHDDHTMDDDHLEFIESFPLYIEEEGVLVTHSGIDPSLDLEKATENHLVPLDDRKEIVKKLLACLVRPLVTADWWEKMLTLVEKIAREVPCYILRFDKSGNVVDLLEQEFGAK